MKSSKRLAGTNIKTQCVESSSRNRELNSHARCWNRNCFLQRRQKHQRIRARGDETSKTSQYAFCKTGRSGENAFTRPELNANGIYPEGRHKKPSVPIVRDSPGELQPPPETQPADCADNALLNYSDISFPFPGRLNHRHRPQFE